MTPTPLNNDLNLTFANFYFDDPSTYITIKDFTAPSPFAIATGVLSTLGGIFGFVEIVYGTIFGRTIRLL